MKLIIFALICLSSYVTGQLPPITSNPNCSTDLLKRVENTYFERILKSAQDLMKVNKYLMVLNKTICILQDIYECIKDPEYCYHVTDGLKALVKVSIIILYNIFKKYMNNPFRS